MHFSKYHLCTFSYTFDAAGKTQVYVLKWIFFIFVCPESSSLLDLTAVIVAHFVCLCFGCVTALLSKVDISLCLNSHYLQVTFSSAVHQKKVAEKNIFC